MQPPDTLAQCGPWRWLCRRRALAFWSGSLQLDTPACAQKVPLDSLESPLKDPVSFFSVKIYRNKSVESVEPRWRLPSIASRSRVSDGRLAVQCPHWTPLPTQGLQQPTHHLRKVVMSFPSFLLHSKSPSRLSTTPWSLGIHRVLSIFRLAKLFLLAPFLLSPHSPWVTGSLSPSPSKLSARSSPNSFSLQSPCSCPPQSRSNRNTYEP